MHHWHFYEIYPKQKSKVVQRVLQQKSDIFGQNYVLNFAL